MSGVDAQGDPCTATIFWSIVRPHLLHFSSSPYTCQSRVYYSNLIIITWFHKNVSNEICILLTHLPCLFLFIIVYIRPTGTGEFSSHHQQNPMWVEGKHTTGCCPVLRRDLLRHCYHHLIAMQPSARCHTSWRRWTTALSAVPRLYPLHD
jgi:hypothetical protein